MKKPLLLLLFSAFCFIPVFSQAQVQNLVPNPSFEQYNTCPINSNPISDADSWFAANNTPSLYFNACGNPGGGGGVPSNSFGFQYARNGVAQTAIESYNPGTSPSNARSYIEAPLNKTLQAGKTYCVQFFVNLANDKGDPNGTPYALSDMGAFFSDTAIITINSADTSFYPLSFLPQINNPVTNYLTDTLNWMPVSGSFTANGGEKFITFIYNNSQLHIKITGNPTENEDGAFYYIDDVSVIELPDSAAGENTTICTGDSAQLGKIAESGFTYSWYPTTGLSNSASSQPWAKPAQTTTYYVSVQDSAGCSSTDAVTVTVCQVQIPNVITPNNDGKNDAFYIENLPAQSTLLIFNRWGNTVYHSLNYQNNWEAENVSAGTYYYLLTLPDGTVKKGFLEIIK